MDVLCVFKEGKRFPHPIKFKISEKGEEKTVDIAKIVNTRELGAGGMSRIEYACVSPGSRGEIRYTLSYYYITGKWELSR